MTAEQALAELEALGTEQNRKVYQRHGVKPPLFGVSYANLDRLRKRIKRDHALAQRLWASGNHDGRVLATKIADPAQADAAFLESWIDDLDNYVLTDAFSQLVAASKAGRERAVTWIDSADEWTSSVGWTVVAIRPRAFEDQLGSLIRRVESSIHAAPNRTRHAMNNALIAIGILGDPWGEEAIEAATRIGRVEVDHGETGCKTPDAVAYVRKSRKRTC